MKYLNILLITILLVCSNKAWAGSTQTNVSGSNTAIEGNYTGGSTTYESGSESSSTTTSTNTSNIKSAPPTSNAPSYNSMTQDVCAIGASAGIQTFGIGVSGGKHMIDKNCERLKLSRILNDFGMKVGTAYQIYDDCIDLIGKEESAGKTLGTDLTKGKLTLPVLNLIASGTETQKKKLNERLLLKEPIDVNTLAGIADYDGAIQRAVLTGKEILSQAREHLVDLNDGPHQKGLIQITNYLGNLFDNCKC